MNESNQKNRSPEAESIIDPEIAKAMQLITKRCGDQIDIETLLQDIPIGRSSFYERFKKTVGESPHEYLQQHRIEKMKELLVKTNLTLENIAYLCGFKRAEYMSSVFKQRTGESPGIYRKSKTSNNNIEYTKDNS
jgi:LacI family transcriptional regulator